MFKKVSLSDKLKFEKVTGNNNKVEANIAGITQLIYLKVDAMTHHHTFYYICLLGYLIKIFLNARSMKTNKQ